MKSRTPGGDLCERVRETTGDLMRGMALELVEVRADREMGRLFLRMSIDRPEGVTVEDCARASALIEQVLERDGIVSGPYTLEVMSPGIDRHLKKPEDFAKSKGKRIKVRLREPEGGGSSHSGVVLKADGESVTLEIDGEQREFEYGSISSARLDPELPW